MVFVSKKGTELLFLFTVFGYGRLQLFCFAILELSRVEMERRNIAINMRKMRQMRNNQLRVKIQCCNKYVRASNSDVNKSFAAMIEMNTHKKGSCTSH